MEPDIDSTELLLYLAPVTSIFHSIIATNTTERDIYIDVKCLRPDSGKPTFAYKRLITKYQSIEVLPDSRSLLIMEPGDFLYAQSDFSGNTFDIIAAYTQLLETAPIDSPFMASKLKKRDRLYDR
jgi:hypothetical protein